MMSTLGLGELSSAPAQRRRGRPHDERPHVFELGRCWRCQMLETWAGARYACEGSAYPERAPRCSGTLTTGRPCPYAATSHGMCNQHRRARTLAQAKAEQRAELAAYLDARGVACSP